MLHTNFLLLLLILPLSIIADDSSSLQPQDLTPPITSSDADDALQRVTDSDLSPETLLAGIENNGVADCQSPPPGGRTRRSRLLRKRQTDFCSWQPYKGGAPTTTTSPQTGYDGAGTPLVPSTKIGPVDVKSPEEGKAPVSIPLGGTGNSEICGPSKETIPVCHWTPERLGSSRWLSPTLQLTPVRLYSLGEVCMGLEETWCCSSTSPRGNENFDLIYPATVLLYPLAGGQCKFVSGPLLGHRTNDGFPTWK